jgi:hypothetical protein
MRAFLNRSTKFWKDAPTACFGASAASFLCHHFWYFHFQLHNPREPDVRNGLIYPFDIKGHSVYVSASDKNFGAVTFILATGFLFLFLAAASQASRTIPPQDRRFQFDQGLTLLLSFALMMGFYFFFGRSIADLLVSNGVVLIWS